jgi:uncharacterized protein with HEPN domain
VKGVDAEAQRVYLDHIAQAIARIKAYVAVSKKAFLADAMRQDAVIRQFEILGEAANRLDESLKAARPEIPWRQIVANRNRLVHGYFQVNLEVLWATATKDLAALAKAVDALRRR